MRDILDKVSEEAIYRRFAKHFPQKVCHSPFRDDKNPSFGFFKKGTKWCWKDLGNGDHGDIFDYVARIETTDLQGAIQIIAEAFFISDNTNQVIVNRRFSPEAADKANERKKSLIQVVRRDYEPWEYDWWNRILLHRGLLEFYFIRAAQEVWVDKQLYWFNDVNNPIYYCLSPISKNIKCYRPLEENKAYKWLSSQDPNVDVQGYWQCDIQRNPGRPLLLTKSFKDVAFFRAFGFNSMANTSENTFFNPDFIRHIKKYCFPIIYIGDNDWAGRKATLKTYNKHDIAPMLIPQTWGAKDPTDLWLANYRKVYDLLNNIYDYIKYLRAAGPGVTPPRRFRAT